MKPKSVFQLSHVAAIVLMLGQHGLAEETVLFSDSFSDVKGYVIGQTDGKIAKGGEAATRHLLPFMGVSPLANGKLTIAAYEDTVSVGPDGNPGLLAISIIDVPRVASYWGFAYLGGLKPGSALTLQELTARPTLEELQLLKLRFRYKATNDKDAAATGAAFGCRLEPLVENSYAARLAFGSIQATAEWQTFEQTLGQGENVENFLKSVTMTKPGQYKLLWSQLGPITGYQPGDTLLIDDIQILRAAPVKP
jgi:hypothetical protein